MSEAAYAGAVAPDVLTSNGGSKTFALPKQQQQQQQDEGEGEGEENIRGTGITTTTTTPAAAAAAWVTVAHVSRVVGGACGRDYLVKSLRVAMCVVDAVRLAHRSGNIAFCCSNGGGGNGSATGAVAADKILSNNNESSDHDDYYKNTAQKIVVRYGQQSAPNGYNHCYDAIKSDLFQLGASLYELFSGVSPFTSTNNSVDYDDDDDDDGGRMIGVTTTLSDDDDDDDEPMKKRSVSTIRRPDSRGRQPYVPLRDFGLPVSLDILVSDLLDAGNDSDFDSLSHRPYQTAEEVATDIELIMENPERYLFDDLGVAKGGGNSLTFPVGKLYGRNKDIIQLMSTYDRVIGQVGGSTEVVLAVGYSGTGKSSLIEQVRGPIVERGGYFISGKFDQLSTGQPLSAIVSALNLYCEELVISNKGDLNEIKTAIIEAVGSYGEVLTLLIPNLSKVIGDQSHVLSVHVEGIEALNRLVFFFRKFMQAISSPSHPIIIFLDDLHWADEASLELINMLVSDTEISPFLFVGCYRDNEVGPDHPLASQLGRIAAAHVPVTKFVLDNIDRDSVNALVSDTLGLFPRLTQSLTDIVHQKTSGNPLFVVQFLSSLCDEGLLSFSASTRRWEWDEDAIREKGVADNVADLLMRKMLRLSPSLQWGLKRAACLGAQCEVSTLELLSEDSNGSSANMVALLDIAEAEGLVYRLRTVFKFSHDQIQKAAYCLTPKEDREALHLEIGRTLNKKAPPSMMEDIIFVVADQLNRGSHVMVDRSEKLELAYMNLKAGEKAASSSAFLAASVYLKNGIGLLEEEDWQENYELCLQLLNLCAEVEYVVGRSDGARILLDELLNRARVFEDKLRAYVTLVKSLGARANASEAIDTGFEVLEKLGESFPKVADVSVMMEDLVLTKGLLESTDEGSFSDMPLMTDEHKLAAMKVLNLLVLYTYVLDQERLPLVSFRMVRLSLTHGFCKESSFGFAILGTILCGIVGDLNGGYRMGKLAIRLVDKFKAQECLAGVYASVYGTVNIWTDPIQASLPQHLVAHDVGLSSGYPEYAMVNAQSYIVYSFQCGKPLEALCEEMNVFRKEFLKYKQDMMLTTMLPYWQAALNLMGKSEDPVILSGEIIDQEAFTWENLENQNFSSNCIVSFVRLILAYLFGKYELAAEMAENSRNINRLLLATWDACTHAFYDGLTALALAISCSENTKWRGIADNAIERMEVWANNSSWNCAHRLQLMNAEAFSLAGDLTKAAESFDEAIELAREHGFVNEQALALERAGIFHLRIGDEASSKAYYSRSRQCYLEWGAQMKADDIDGFCQ